MTTLVEEIVDPTRSIVLGGSWRIPVLEGLLNKNFVTELKLDGTFNESSFSREYKNDLYSLNIVNCEEILRAA